ncbi:hypothetical protein QNN00_16940 [Bacillus velezensis]|nr:hypothetical protein [Bacillus velezensis]
MAKVTWSGWFRPFARVYGAVQQKSGADSPVHESGLVYHAQ